MIKNSTCLNYLSNWRIPFGKEAVAWYFLNSCVALIKTNYSVCSILESYVLFSTVSEITSLNFGHTVICCIFRLWLTVLLIISPPLVAHMGGSCALFIVCSATLHLTALWPFPSVRRRLKTPVLHQLAFPFRLRVCLCVLKPHTWS